MHTVSPLAQISPEVTLGKNVSIAPFVIIEGNVSIGDHTVIHPFVHIKGPVEIGESNQIFNNVSIGTPAQDLSYKPSPRKIIIGNNNVIRESVTIHAPVNYEDPTISPDTIIGNSCLLMVGSHVAHNTVLKNHVIFANGVLPAGCCVFEDGVFLSGGVLIHQHVRVGAYTIISGGSRVGRDIPPFSLVSSFYGLISGINAVGLRRAGFTIEERNIAKILFKIFKQENSLAPALEKIKETFHNQLDQRVVAMTITFLEGSKRGISSFGEGTEAKESMI
ncbi:MAG: acyl-ACP--UDP-N-acetylglucosamine O-acyltransferase [Brevinema sp.]